MAGAESVVLCAQSEPPPESQSQGTEAAGLSIEPESSLAGAATVAEPAGLLCRARHVHRARLPISTSPSRYQLTLAIPCATFG